LVEGVETRQTNSRVDVLWDSHTDATELVDSSDGGGETALQGELVQTEGVHATKTNLLLRNSKLLLRNADGTKLVRTNRGSQRVDMRELTETEVVDATKTKLGGHGGATNGRELIDASHRGGEAGEASVEWHGVQTGEGGLHGHVEAGVETRELSHPTNTRETAHTVEGARDGTI